MASRKLEVEIVGDTRDLERAFGRAASSTKGFGSKIASGAKTAALGIAGLTVAGTALGAKMVDWASDAAEVESKFKVVFGKTMPRLTKELDAFSQATGASRFALREQTADMGALLKPLSESTEQAGKMSVQFVKLATDLSSFNNVPVEDALLAIRSGLVGEAEPLRRFGVLLNEAAVKAEAYRSGIAKSGAELTEQQKVQARANLIMAQTKLAQGDAERTSGSFANQVRRLQNGLRDMGTEIGQTLMPHMLRLVSWVNDNMPTIQRVVDSTITGITATIQFLAPIIATAIGWFRSFASFVSAHWGEVQAAADRAVAWYRANIAPAIQNVLAGLEAFWDRFGAAITRIVQTSFGAALTIVRTTLGNIASVVQVVLAVLRGDWGKAWDELKEIPRRTLGAVVTLVRGFASNMLTAAKALGSALIDGIKAGIDATWTKVTTWLSSLPGKIKDYFADAGTWLLAAGKAIIQGLWDGAKEKFVGFAKWLGSLPGRIKDLKGPPAKDAVLLHEIGRLIIGGLQTGMEQRWTQVEALLSGLSEKMREKVGAAVDAARQAIESRQGAFATAFGTLTSEALSAFDKLAAEIETKTERKLRLMDERRAEQERKQAIADARTALAQAQAQFAGVQPGEGEDPQAYANRLGEATAAITAAQARLDEALAAQKRAALERQAAEERLKLNDRLALRRRHFEEELGALQRSLEQGRISKQQFHQRLIAMFEAYHVPYKKGANKLGLAVAEGLNDALKEVENAANALVWAITNRLNNIRVVIGVDVRGSGESDRKGKALGGSVLAGRSYLVGERGPELFVSRASGAIIPNNILTAITSGFRSGAAAGIGFAQAALTATAPARVAGTVGVAAPTVVAAPRAPAVVFAPQISVGQVFARDKREIAEELADEMIAAFRRRRLRGLSLGL